MSPHGRLFQFAEPGTSGSATHYRAWGDDSFTRYTRLADDLWEARATSGIVNKFQRLAVPVDDRFVLVSSTDRFGNTVRYNWRRVTTVGGLSADQLDAIEYTANDAAGLVAHARVTFVYGAQALCGTSVTPVGAQFLVGAGRGPPILAMLRLGIRTGVDSAGPGRGRARAAHPRATASRADGQSLAARTNRCPVFGRMSDVASGFWSAPDSGPPILAMLRLAGRLLRSGRVAMSVPRQVVPGSFYMLNRRCTQRQFLLRPDRATNETVLYCLAESAQRFGIDLILPAVLSNHHHIVLFDRHGRVVEFAEHLHKFIAKAMNTLRGRWENFWSSEPLCLVRLVNPADVLDKLVYVATNPVKDRLVDRVHHWPGIAEIRTGVDFGGIRPGLIPRDRGGAGPEQLTLERLPAAAERPVRGSTNRPVSGLRPDVGRCVRFLVGAGQWTANSRDVEAGRTFASLWSCRHVCPASGRAWELLHAQPSLHPAAVSPAP